MNGETIFRTIMPLPATPELRPIAPALRRPEPAHKRRYFQSRGYRVLVAASGPEAIAASRAQGGGR
jgi:hypothetical protein